MAFKIFLFLTIFKLISCMQEDLDLPPNVNLNINVDNICSSDLSSDDQVVPRNIKIDTQINIASESTVENSTSLDLCGGEMGCKILMQLQAMNSKLESIKKSTAVCDTGLCTEEETCIGYNECGCNPGSNNYDECIKNLGCPIGFFKIEIGGSQCFKYIEEDLLYPTYVARCESIGSVAAKPDDPKKLQEYIDSKQNYFGGPSTGNTGIFLGAKNNGNEFVWEKDSSTLSNDSPLMNSNTYYPANASNRDRLGIRVGKPYSDKERPYYAFKDWIAHKGLCELLM